MSDRIYEIPATNMVRLEDEIAKMNKRAEKLGCTPVKLTVVKSVHKTRKDELLGFDYEYSIHHCTVDGERPMLAGWNLVAILDPQPNADMLVREVPGMVCPKQYRTTDCRCDHCAAIRRRNHIYILTNGRVHKQVGKNCLSDFLGGANPESLLSRAEYLMDFAKLAEDAEREEWGGCWKSQFVIPLHHFVAACAVAIRKMGWVSGKTAYEAGEDSHIESTANAVWNLCMNPKEKHVKEMVEKFKLRVEDSDAKLAAAAIQWGANIDPDKAESTYIHDLGVCCRQEYVTFKTKGFVASLINAYQREEAKRLAAVAPKRASQHVGVLDKRQVFEDLTITSMSDYMAGIYPKTFVKFEDKNGNVLIWRASGHPEWLELGKTFTVKGTVEEHGQYNGTAQTVLKRVALEEAVAAA
jgi:ribosomal protein L36